MDPHRLAEERSIAMHARVAERLRDRPEIVAQVRARLEARPQGFYRDRWLEILERRLEQICAFVVERTEEAKALRQSTPFAGVLEPRERWEIWRRVRDELTGTEP